MKNSVLALVLLCISRFASAEQDGKPEVFTEDEVAIILTGDTQYPWLCLATNTPCKTATVDGSEIKQSEYSNGIQRKSMESLIKMQRYPPQGLVLNGDLTAYGHGWQLRDFKKLWMDDFPIPIYPGLGNHDYENNINDCGNNMCVRNMLRWFLNFAVEKNLNLQFDVSSVLIARSFKGSIAYTEQLCTLSEKSCVHLIQLHNSIDYSVSLASPWTLEDWTIESSLPQLKQYLETMKYNAQPILINFHKNDKEELLKKILGDWIYANRELPIKQKVGVFFAHEHGEHRVNITCLHGVAVPFVFVGSVPNNRFTVLRLGESGGDRISGYAATEHGPVLLDSLANVWDGPCRQNFAVVF